MSHNSGTNPDLEHTSRSAGGEVGRLSPEYASLLVKGIYGGLDGTKKCVLTCKSRRKRFRDVGEILYTSKAVTRTFAA